MSEEWKPEETPDCCDVWPKIMTQLRWMRFSDHPEFLSMAHIQVGPDSWRVNYCPSCGKEIRDAIVRRERVYD